MKLILIAWVCLLGVAFGAALDFDDLDDKLDEPVPKEAQKYLKQALPFLKMFKMKLKTEECKNGYEGLSSVVEKASNDATVTARSLMGGICELGDDCFMEIVGVVKETVETNKFMKGALDSYLKKYDVSLDQVENGAPLVYNGVCLNYKKATDAIEEGKDEL